MQSHRTSSPSPSIRTNRSQATTSSGQGPASTAASATASTHSFNLPAGQDVKEGGTKAFSVVVTLLSSARPSGSHPDSTMSITRLVQKRKSASASLKLPAASPDGVPRSSGDPNTPSLYRVLQPKPSMLSMPTSKHYEKAKRVRLLLAPDRSATLDVRDEGKDKLLHSIDVGRIEAHTIYLVDRSVFHLPNVVFIPLSARQLLHAPPPPLVPTMLDRHSSLALDRNASPSSGAAASAGGRRPSTKIGTIPQHGASSSSSPPTASEKSKDGNGLYLHFESATAMRSWFALLQSKAIPEIFYRPALSSHASDASEEKEPSLSSWADVTSRPFRLKREVKLTVSEARNLVFSTSTSAPPSLGGGIDYVDLRSLSTPATPAHAPHSPFLHVPHPHLLSTHHHSDTPGVYVELLSGAHSIARTTVKRHAPAPIWEESFVFPFFSVVPTDAGDGLQETLCVVVWKEKSVGKRAVLGKVEVPLGAVGLGEDTWWPIISDSGRRMGDLKLRLSTTEQVVFPLARYGNLPLLSREANEDRDSPLASVLWRASDRDLAVKIIMRVATARGKVEHIVANMISRENLSADTLFRSNTPFTKSMDSFLKEHLVPTFIPHALTRTISRIFDEKLAIEILPPTAFARQFSTDDAAVGELGLTESQKRELERQRRELRKLVEGCWEDIYAARQKVPAHVCEALRKIFASVPPDVKWRAITTLFFLRLLTPAIINPQMFGLSLAAPEGATRRTLLLLAKAMSALSYGGLSDNQPEMRAFLHRVMNTFAPDRQEQVVDFIAFVTRKADEAVLQPKWSGIDAYLQRYREDEHGDPAADLVKESLLVRPLYLDAAADLADLAGVIHRALVMLAEEDPSTAGQYPELRALVAGIVQDESDALEWLMLRRMPPGFYLRSFAPGSMPPSSTSSGTTTSDLVRPPTGQSRSQTLSDLPQLLQPLRPLFSRARSGSSATRKEDGRSVFSHCQATLGRPDHATSAAHANTGRRPSLPAVLLAPKQPNPVFGFKPSPQTHARRWSDSASDDDGDPERVQRHFTRQRAEFSARINARNMTSSASVDVIAQPSSRTPGGGGDDGGQVVSGAMSLAGRSKWKKLWHLKL